MFGRTARTRRLSSPKRSATRNRLLRSEALEPRTLLSGHGLASLIAGDLSVGSVKPANTSPAFTSISIRTASGQVVSPNAAAVVAGTAQAFVVQELDQFGNVLSLPATFTWSTVSAPSGAAAPKLTASSNVEGVAFSAAGNYGLTVQVTAGGVSVKTNVSVSVTQVWTSTKYPAVATVYVTGTSLQPVVPAFLDQFGNPLTNPPALSWSTVNHPAGAPAPVFTTNGNITTVTFGQAGSYMLQTNCTTASSVSFVTLVTVNQTLTTIAVTPNTATVVAGCNQQFTAQGLDQFKEAMVTQPTFAWSTSGGTVTSGGVFTAPNNPGNYTVTAKSGTTAGTASGHRAGQHGLEHGCAGNAHPEPGFRRLDQPTGHDQDSHQRGQQRPRHRRGICRSEDPRQ